MSIFSTVSGSTYEVDTTNKRIRRLNGVKDPQPRQGRDGEWRNYADVVGPVVGKQVFIAWDKTTTPLLAGSPESAIPGTMTSVVVSVEE